MRNLRRGICALLALLLCLALLPAEPAQAASGSVSINETNFPDKKFREYVKEKFDRDHNGVLSKAEIDAVSYISAGGAKSLRGIEYFTALEKLSVNNSPLTELDLSKNTKLTTLDCLNNQLETLVVKNCRALEYLTCSGNQLKTLDVSGLTALKELYCSVNQLKTLDVSGLTALRTLYCNHNRLTKLTLKGCSALKALQCYKNSLKKLDVSDSPELADILEHRWENYKRDDDTVIYGDYATGEMYYSFFGIWCDASTVTTPKAAHAPKLYIKLWRYEYATSLGNTCNIRTVSPCHGFSYQWQYQDAKGQWKDSTLPSAKTEVLSVKATAKRNGTYYRCVVSDGKEQNASAPALFLVIGAPAKLEAGYPADVEAQKGSNAVFSVRAAGVNMSYRWQYRTSSTGKWHNCSSKLEGYNSEKLTVPVTAKRNGYQYRCVVSTEGGKVYSRAATLKMLTKPTITTQPKNRSVKAGSTVKFSVKASGGALSYQWEYRYGEGDYWYSINYLSGASANGRTLTLNADPGYDGYQFRCVVSNAVGTTESKIATLTALTKPEIVSQSISESHWKGETAAFSVAACGGNLHYQWQYRASSTGEWHDCSSKLEGHRSTTLKVPATAKRNGLQFRCVVSNDIGKVCSDPVTLTVFPAPAVTSQPKSVTAAKGDVVSFTVVASGYGLSYQWQYRKSGSETWNDCSSSLTGCRSDVLLVPATAKRNGLQYRCVITNPSGKVCSAPATLTVN